MPYEYEIHPKVGVARLGNSPDEFYLSPESIGGLPIQCDENGNVINEKITRYKDNQGRVKRQAAKFRIFKINSETKEEEGVISLQDGDIEKIVWTSHVANKKPVWYTFSELQGNLDFGEQNSYRNQHIPVNNSDVTDATDRKKLMIDPGPRSVEQPGERSSFSRYNIPENYTYGSFPPVGAGGGQIDTLGELRMDDQGNLIALGGLGQVTGEAQIDSFRGAPGYWDDIADGYVTATIHLLDGSTIDCTPAWLLIGSPKYAPELVNITTLADTMHDVAVRKMGAYPEIFDASQYPPADPSWGLLPSRKHPGQHQPYTPLNGFNRDYEANFERDIKPIMDRLGAYRWVADVPYLNDFSRPGFDVRDNSPENNNNRMEYFNLFRVPLPAEDYFEWHKQIENGPNEMFSELGAPLMPLNSGDNSVTNTGPIYKFETLSPTQYFLLYQWAIGRFNNTPPEQLPEDAPVTAEQLDQASIGNCVGAPFSPGIETTWIVRSKNIYDAPLHLRMAHFMGDNQALATYYSKNGLSTTANEADGQGCEPGDLTKRMAIPWQADFNECTVQTPNITNPLVNQLADGTGIEVPPAYYVYWWPPQSPMHVVAGSLEPGDQVIDAMLSNIDGQTVIPAGQRVPYHRGVEDAEQIIQYWGMLGFIVNEGTQSYPYFVEKERNTVSLGQAWMNQNTMKGKG
ncbi:LodA/GoxA family CTQ-dependent oxidase [Bacterioplanoides sp.]|uniref:LodA/GoxA family CTQ-dependent oxidase n=1 Tax=Bacterioplanoides sp. TaxID=2066072 RepID=UPI003B00B3AD